MYPRVTIDLKALKENCIMMKEYAKMNGIDLIMPVVKVAAGDLEVANIFVEAGFEYLGDSRIRNLVKFKDLAAKKLLLRIPGFSEIEAVIKYSDIVLVSELETVIALNIEAKSQNKKIEIIFMFDLGDLREGVYYKNDYEEIISRTLKLENVTLKGIGTNLTCYGGLVPSNKILNRLVKIKNNIESKFKIKLEVISGGNSSSVFLFDKDEIPKEINSLRIGEAIFFGKETAYSTELTNFNHDIFTLEAEIVEAEIKPSLPDGETSYNSFGELVKIEDKGLMRRAILAIGKQDVQLNNIFPKDEKIKIIGGSSDHLILDITNTNYKLGDIVKFSMNYPGLLHLMNSSYVGKFYK